MDAEARASHGDAKERRTIGGSAVFGEAPRRGGQAAQTPHTNPADGRGSCAWLGPPVHPACCAGRPRRIFTQPAPYMISVSSFLCVMPLPPRVWLFRYSDNSHVHGRTAAKT